MTSREKGAPPRLLALAPPDSSAVLRDATTQAGIELVEVSDLASLMGRLRERAWDATLLSLSVDPVDEAVAAKIAGESASGAVLLSARTVSLGYALLSERVGAVALLREPLDVADLGPRLDEISDEGAEASLPDLPREETTEPLLIGNTPPMAEVFAMIARVAGSSSTVFVTGESGTGKEVVARALHWASDRRDKPFIAVNCAAIPEHLLESELFGHEKGAFTGAVAQRRGRFERADGGTLFLDEIGDMSLVLQAKVLRVLEDRTLERVGGQSTLEVDVRVIAATNHVLTDAIHEGRFREDLYYRLAVVEIPLPPLRERASDIRSLALHFGAHFARRHGRPIRSITQRALRRLEGSPWPGNVRELRNVMDRAVLLTTGEVLRSSALRLGAGAPHASPRTDADREAGYRIGASLADVEADHIERVLASVDGQMSRAATILGIHRNTLTRKVQEYGIDARPLGSAP